MSTTGRDRDAKKIMKVTGAKYSTARREMIRRQELGEIKVYMVGVKAMPLWIEGQPMRCVRCLALEHGKCDR